MEHTIKDNCKILILDILFIAIGQTCLMFYYKYTHSVYLFRDFLISFLFSAAAIIVIYFYPIKIEKNKHIYKNKKALIPYIIIAVILQILIFILNKLFGLNSSTAIFFNNRMYIYFMQLGVTATLLICYFFKIKFKKFNWGISFNSIVLVIIVYIICRLEIIVNGDICFNKIFNVKFILYFIKRTIQESLYPGFFEEVLNRGLLISGLKGFGFSDNKCNIIQAVIFGISHIGSFGTVSWIFLLFTASQTMAGYITGKVYFKTKSLVPCIILHGLMDAVQI